MNAEFQTDPARVNAAYGIRVAETLSRTRVADSGLFDRTGTFDIVRWGEKRGLYSTAKMWAGDLLRFTEAENGLRAQKTGVLWVYSGRKTRFGGDDVTPVHLIYPINVRFVEDWDSFRTKVSESGWVFNERAAYRQRREFQADGKGLSPEQLEEILVQAEAGKKPDFFDDRTQYVKVEPGLAGREVQVIRFDTNDTVVVDVEARQLVGKKVEPLLSREKWERVEQI